MNRRSFLRLLGIAPVTATTASYATTSVELVGYRIFNNAELREVSCIRVPLAEATYTKLGALPMDIETVRELETR